VPTCRICGKPMILLDEEALRYYCSKDNQVWLGRERKWVGQGPDEIEKKGEFYALYVDGYRNLTGKLAMISLAEQSIKINFFEPPTDSYDALRPISFKVSRAISLNQLEFPYSSIEVLNIGMEREITALRTFLIGPVFAAWFKKKTLTLTIGVREKDRLLQLLSFKMETSTINDCYDRVYERLQKAKTA